MDTNLARRITELYSQVDYLGMVDRTTEQEAELIAKESELDILIHKAQRQLVIDAARQATLESYRR